jgi:SAM-dependent methyltransferase
MTQRSVEYGKKLNWSAVSGDYSQHRNGYPSSFFKLLKALGIGLIGQCILDLGTGTGALAIPFTQQGADVTGLDLAEGQIVAAKNRAKELGLSVKFIVSGAEKTGLSNASFDLVTASMCWGYFDKQRVVPEVKRLLRPKGLLLTSSILWVAQPGSVGEHTNELLARYNPEYSRRQDGNEESDIPPDWAFGHFKRLVRHKYTESLRFSKKAWRGRIRASKWIGAALTPEKVEAFDQEHQRLLEKEPEEFHLLHQIKFEIFKPV